MTREELKRREQLIQRYAPLVKIIVARIRGYLPDWVDEEDLISAGIVGLIKAIDRFQPSRGVKFETYATPVIRGEIMESLRAKDWVPRSVRRKARQVGKAIAELEVQLGRPPTEEEIARHMGMTLEEYHAVLEDTARAALLSFEEVFADGDDRSGIGGQAAIEPEDEDSDPVAVIEREELKRLIAEAIERLPEREKLVVGLYYQEGLTLKEIGAVLGITESRVSQIHSQAMARVRAAVMRELRI